MQTVPGRYISGGNWSKELTILLRSSLFQVKEASVSFNAHVGDGVSGWGQHHIGLI